MRIMVPVDGSEFSEQAMPVALEIATRAAGRCADCANGCVTQIHIVRAHALPLAAAIAPVSAYFNDALDRETRAAEVEYLRRTAAKWAAHAGTTIRPFTLDAPVADALADHVVANDIALVVMTTHGRGGLSRAWLGSVADRLVRTASVPILLHRPASAGAHAHVAARNEPRILIPLDGSALAESIIDAATRLGRLTDASYTLMQVIGAPVMASAAATAQFALDAAQIRAEASQYLGRQAALMRARGFDVDTRVIMQSNVAAGIVEEAVESECDLIAMATHGRSGWSRIALGSVADKVLRSAQVPLLVLKPDSVLLTQLRGA